MCFKIYRQTKFHPHRTTSGEDMTSYQFSRWQPWWRSTTSGFPIVEKVKFYHQTKCRRHSSIYGWDITSFVLEKETSAILEFYSRLWFRLYHRKRHVILHQRSKYHLYRTTHCGNITSYRFFKMAAAAAQYYFRFRVCSCCCLQKAKMYQQAKFRPRIGIHGWCITTFTLEKQTSAILEFYFQFWPRPSGYQISCKSEHPVRKYDVITIYQDGGCGRSILLPVSYLLMSLPLECQSLSANQIS